MKRYLAIPGYLLLIAALIRATVNARWDALNVWAAAVALVILAITIALNWKEVVEWVRDPRGVFAVTTGIGEEAALSRLAVTDDYGRIIFKALCDRLAEAFAEAMHAKVRRELWGYAADETASNEDLIAERYQGIRPAPGYPAQPDHTEKETLFGLLGGERIGVKLTESFAMWPAASVSALRNPRHALETSKICAVAGRPIFRCANEAVAGSSMSRLTAAWMKSSTSFAPRPERAITALPAAALASDGRVPAGHMRRSRIPVISSSRPAGKIGRAHV